MDVIKVQLDRIKQQLAGLTATQRMLVGTLVTIMGFTLYYAVHFAGTPEMTPVLDQAMSDGDIAQISGELERHGIAYSVSGGRVMVPSERRAEAVAELMYARVLPHDTPSVFETLNKEVGAFSPGDEREDMRVEITQRQMAQIICRWPDVVDATVVINAKDQQRIEGSILPSATVSIQTHDGTGGTKNLIKSAAESIVGAVPGLTRGQVRVIIDGIAHRLADNDNSAAAGGDDYIDLKRQNEDMLEENLRKCFAEIPGLFVTVNCDVDNTTKSEEATVYDPKGTLTKEYESTDHTTETSGPVAGGGEAGAGANTSASIAGGTGGGQGSNSTSEDTTSKSQTFAGGTKTHVDTPPGKEIVKSATVRVPRSHFVANYKVSNSNSEPDETALQASAALELAQIRQQAMNCLGLDSDKALSVAMYTDAAPSMNLTAAAVTQTPSGGVGSVSGYAKEIAIGVLAVVSLFMMSSMVKKATPAPVAVVPVEVKGTPILDGAEQLAGEAAFANATLDGMELDEDAMKTQQMLDQVTTMVKENPDGAAALVKRWLNRT
jgi:flagellar biosynthesis/type III secretory pathway M-ring protein FliF/YscJ